MSAHHRSRSRRRAVLVAAAALGSLAAPAAADAQLYCVGTQSCYLGSQKATIAEALIAAGNSPGEDTVRLGPGTYTGPFGTGSGKVTIIGAGRDATVLQSSQDSAPTLGIGEGALRNLSVRATASAALEIDDAVVENVDARTTSIGGQPAIRVTGPSQLDDVIAKAPSGIALRTTCQDGCSIRDSDLEGLNGIRALGGSQLTVDGVRVRAGVAAVSASEAMTHVSVQRSLLTTAGPQGSGAGIGQGATGSFRHVTITRSGAGSGFAGLVSLGKDGDAAGVVAEGVVVTGYDTPVWRLADGAPADLTVRASAWDRSKEKVDASNGPGTADIDPSNVDLAGRSAGFTDALAGDFKPLPGSPLLDGVPGAPPAGFTDLAGASATDGDGNGVVLADIGAFEGAAGQPVEPPPAGGGGNGGGGVEQPPVGEQPPAGTQPDTIAPLLSALSARKRGKTVRVAFKLSEPGKVALRIERRRGRRFVALAHTRTLKAVAGRNRVTLRLKKRLPRGTYRVVARPVDAAGNRGKQRRAGVR